MKKLITILVLLSFIFNIKAQDTTVAGVQFYQYKDSNNIVYYKTKSEWVSKKIVDRVTLYAIQKNYDVIKKKSGLIFYTGDYAFIIIRKRYWDGDAIYKVIFIKKY